MFITNKGNVGEQPAKAASMSERLREIIPATGTLSILSGYFYFNGVPPLMGPIAENKDLTLKILVGLDVDKMGYELAHAGDGDSAQEKFLNSLKNFAQSKMSDSEKCALSMETFLKMLDEGRLQIKKTKEPNHAKLYIFEMKKEVAKATDPIRWITGSSNLTYPGLNSQNEFNIELSNRVKTAATGVKAGTHLFTRKGLTLFASFMGAEDKEPSYLLMKEALEYVKCPFEQPRLEKFSDGFWERYGALTRGTGVQEVKKVEGATSLPKKVMPILVEAKQNGIQPDFVQYLMGNLQHLGTLPDHVLHDIIKAKKKGWTALESYLASLKDGMGDDYASLLLPGEDDDVVIVAIDKQVDG